MTSGEPLFLSGNQRSGKTLMQLMLSSHPDISISPGSQTLQRILLDMPRTRPLDPDEVSRVIGFVKADGKLRAWRVDHQALLARLAHRERPTARDLAGDLMAFFRDQTKPGATIVGNKKGFYCKYADVVREVFPEARFVFMLRDGRGAVASMLDNQPEHDVVSASLMWRMKAQRIRELAWGFPRDCLVVRYESLVADPERTCRELCGFIGIQFTRSMITNYRTNDAVRHVTDVSHPATFEPITTAFVDRWRTRLSPRELATVEAIAGLELEAHGYPLASTSPLAPDERRRLDELVARDHAAFREAHLRRVQGRG
jgi:hypothetical protein